MRRQTVTIMLLLALVSAAPAVAKGGDGTSGDGTGGEGSLGWVVQPNFVGLTENGTPPTAEELDGTGVVTIGGRDGTVELIWTNNPTTLLLADGTSLTAKWSGTLTAATIQTVHDYLMNGNGLDWSCTTTADKPDVNTTRVWGYAKQRCTGDDVIKFRIKTILQLRMFEWTSITSGTSSWTYPPAIKVGKSKVQYCNYNSNSRKWRTQGQGNVILSGGYGPVQYPVNSDAVSGPCGV